MLSPVHNNTHHFQCQSLTNDSLFIHKNRTSISYNSKRIFSLFRSMYILRIKELNRRDNKTNEKKISINDVMRKKKNELKIKKVIFVLFLIVGLYKRRNVLKPFTIHFDTFMLIFSILFSLPFICYILLIYLNIFFLLIPLLT